MRNMKLIIPQILTNKINERIKDVKIYPLVAMVSHLFIIGCLNQIKN